MDVGKFWHSECLYASFRDRAFEAEAHVAQLVEQWNDVRARALKVLEGVVQDAGLIMPKSMDDLGSLMRTYEAHLNPIAAHRDQLWWDSWLSTWLQIGVFREAAHRICGERDAAHEVLRKCAEALEPFAHAVAICDERDRTGGMRSVNISQVKAALALAKDTLK